tara:strand:+ start:934 stop:1281 length:348 start_codon:yes stop_codon:yes gene_type:complete
MPYKNPEDQVAAAKRHYQENKDKIKARSYERNKVQRKRNREFVKSIKEISECIDCGESNPLVLDFDHVKGDKILAISDMANRAYGIESISEEMDKCEVRCANCHRIITDKRKYDK